MSTRAAVEPTTDTVPRLGFFGLLGSGNLGNDGSFEAVLGFVRRDHPDVELVCFCSGPDQVERRYGVPARSMHWYREGSRFTVAAKAFGKLADAFRTFRWVGSLDAVVVPGMGVLEATLPLRPWGFPYALLLVCAAGRLRGTKVALVSVGAADTRQPVTRRLIAACARLASYRSYRDQLSKDAMTRMGVDTAADGIYPDLAFALPTPSTRVTTPKTVGVGVMAYHGTSLDRGQAAEIHDTYVTKMRSFVRRLTGEEYMVRLFTGDHADVEVSAAILADHDDGSVVAEPAASLGELMRQMAGVDVIVASRYHNVLCALKLAKPTISISYAEKNDVLMAQLGMGDYCQPIRTFDVDRLTRQVGELVARREPLRLRMTARNRANERLLDEQFAALSAALFGQRG